MITVFSLFLYFLLYNFYHFLIKQQKWRVTPILFFYIVAILIVLIRIFDFIFLAELTANANIEGITIPPVLKLSIGLV